MTKSKTIILFVDDRPETISVFIDLLKEKSIEARWVETIDEALFEIIDLKDQITGVVIDLKMPGTSKLDKYQREYHVSINQGQSLGLYLRENHPDIKYFYISNVPESYSKPESLEKQEKVIDKYKVELDEFMHLCKEVFEIS